MYDPHKYWHARGFRYDSPTDFSRDGVAIASAISIYRKPEDKFLEVGPGDGRIYTLLTSRGVIEPVSYAGCDISQTMAHRCFEKTGYRPRLWDGVTLPYGDRAFEWVLLIEVLLHVPHKDIKQFLGEMVRVCGRHIYVSTYTGPHEPQAKHCFKHDYLKLFKQNGLEIVRERPMDAARTHWTLRRGM